MDLEERAVDCPCCGARFVALVDPTEAGTEYVQDCEVCCRPIRFRLGIDAGGRIELTTVRDDG